MGTKCSYDPETGDVTAVNKNWVFVVPAEHAGVFGLDPPFEDRAPHWVHWDCALRDMAIYDFWVQVGIAGMYEHASAWTPEDEPLPYWEDGR
jgi:hypothetical protein